ncbi:hypothetical protein [Vibrio rarus]
MTKKIDSESIAETRSYSLIPRLDVTGFIDHKTYQKACFTLIGAVELASSETFGKAIQEMEHNAFVETWDYVENPEEMLESVPIYKLFDAMYQYGQLGNIAFQRTLSDDDLLRMLPILHMNDFIYEQLFSAESPSYLVLTMLHKYLARLKLDLGINLDEDWDTVSVFFPFAHAEDFNLYEIALLANVKNVNSIRNAAYSQEDRLQTFKEDGKQLVTRFDAIEWLTKRKHFVESFSLEIEGGTKSPLDRVSVTPKRSQTILTYITRSGKNQGQIQVPHKHSNGKYVVSMTRFAEDYIYIDSIEDILGYLQKGYKVRMSGRDIKTPASLVGLSSIKIN